MGTCRNLQRCSGALETNIWAAATVAGCCCAICILFLTPSRCIPFLLPPILEYFNFLFSIDGAQIGKDFSYPRTTLENVLECVILVSGCWARTHTWPQHRHNSTTAVGHSFLLQKSGPASTDHDHTDQFRTPQELSPDAAPAKVDISDFSFLTSVYQ